MMKAFQILSIRVQLGKVTTVSSNSTTIPMPYYKKKKVENFLYVKVDFDALKMKLIKLAGRKK